MLRCKQILHSESFKRQGLQRQTGSATDRSGRKETGSLQVNSKQGINTTGVLKKLCCEMKSRKMKPEVNKFIGEASLVFLCSAEGQKGEGLI